MTHAKPLITAELKRGVLIDTIRNLVDTLNWVISCWANIDTDEDSLLKIDKVSEGTPTFSIDKDEIRNIAKEAAEEVINNPEIQERFIEAALSRISIVGGSNTNLQVERTGNTFKLDLYWK